METELFKYLLKHIPQVKSPWLVILIVVLLMLLISFIIKIIFTCVKQVKLFYDMKNYLKFGNDNIEKLEQIERRINSSNGLEKELREEQRIRILSHDLLNYSKKSYYGAMRKKNPRYQPRLGYIFWYFCGILLSVCYIFCFSFLKYANFDLINKIGFSFLLIEIMASFVAIMALISFYLYRWCFWHRSFRIDIQKPYLYHEHYYEKVLARCKENSFENSFKLIRLRETQRKWWKFGFFLFGIANAGVWCLSSVLELFLLQQLNLRQLNIIDATLSFQNKDLLQQLNLRQLNIIDATLSFQNKDLLQQLNIDAINTLIITVNIILSVLLIILACCLVFCPKKGELPKIKTVEGENKEWCEDKGKEEYFHKLIGYIARSRDSVLYIGSEDVKDSVPLHYIDLVSTGYRYMNKEDFEKGKKDLGNSLYGTIIIDFSTWPIDILDKEGEIGDISIEVPKEIASFLKPDGELFIGTKEIRKTKDREKLINDIESKLKSVESFELGFIQKYPNLSLPILDLLSPTEYLVFGYRKTKTD